MRKIFNFKVHFIPALSRNSRYPHNSRRLCCAHRRSYLIRGLDWLGEEQVALLTDERWGEIDKCQNKKEEREALPRDKALNAYGLMPGAGCEMDLLDAFVARGNQGESCGPDADEKMTSGSAPGGHLFAEKG